MSWISFLNLTYKTLRFWQLYCCCHENVSFLNWYDIGDIMTGAACEAGNAYPSGAPDFISDFHRGSCCPVICVSLFHVMVLSSGFEFWCSFCFIAWYMFLYFLLYQHCYISGYMLALGIDATVNVLFYNS